MRAVFLDLDGTLIDSQAGICRSVQHALAGMGAEVPEETALTWGIGASLWEIFGKLLGPDADLDRAVALYRERFTVTGLYEAEVYDGIHDMLGCLRDEGARLWIATSKPEAYAGKVADHFGLSPYLEGLFGAELDGTRSDKVALLSHALERTGVAPSDAAMIGDRHLDVEGARGNGLGSVGVLWGFAEPGEFDRVRPDAQAGHPCDVPGLLRDMAGAAA